MPPSTSGKPKPAMPQAPPTAIMVMKPSGAVQIMRPPICPDHSPTAIMANW